MGEQNQQFDNFDQWVNKASSWLTRYPLNKDGSDPACLSEDHKPDWYRASCFDAKGRPCLSGREFMRARDEDAFPVRWLWPHQIAQIASERNEMLKALRGTRILLRFHCRNQINHSDFSASKALETVENAIIEAESV